MFRHSEGNPFVKRVWQCGPPLTQPLYVGAVAATWTSSRFAGVVEDEFLVFRSVNLGTQLGSATLHRLGENPANYRAHLVPVPVGTRLTQNLLERLAVFHVNCNSFCEGRTAIRSWPTKTTVRLCRLTLIPTDPGCRASWSCKASSTAATSGLVFCSFGCGIDRRITLLAARSSL